MPHIFTKLSESTLLRYIFVGGVAFLFEIGVIYIATQIFQASSVVAVAISFWIGLVVSFMLQKVFAFKDKTKTVKRLLKQSLAYGLLIVVNYIFTLWLVSLLEHLIGPYIARTIALIITTAWNFIVYSKIIFKADQKEINS